MEGNEWFRVLGPLAVTVGETDVTPTAPRQRATLAILLINVGKVVSTDRMIDALWEGAPPATARSALSVHIAELRKHLGSASSRVETVRPGYVLHADGAQIDAVKYEELVAAGGRALAADQPALALEHFATAEGLWRGPAYVDFEYAEFAQSESRRLTGLRDAAIAQRIDAQLLLGQHLEIVGELESLTDRSPGDQRLWAQLMLALYRSGRQHAALGAYRRAADSLAEMGLEPTAPLRRLEEQILMEDPELGHIGRPERRTNLPAPRSSFVGRESELVKAGKLLADNRLITITGPGGVGKTRFALELATRTAGSYAGGAWLVDLGTAQEADEIDAAWAEAFGISGAPNSGIGRAVARRLSDDPTLVIVDNVEHVIAKASTSIGDVLDNATGATVIATGRDTLGIAGEAVFPLSPMRVPDCDPAEPPPAEAIQAHDSVRLLVERVTALDPEFATDSETLQQLGELCCRLDGLPLAIELAAVHIPALGSRVILDRLAAGLGLPEINRPDSPARHQTLWNTMMWSYELMDSAEQALFRRLSIFSGVPDLDTVGSVCAFAEIEPDAVPGLVATLVRGSMVLRVPLAGGGRGYSLLDTVREFARTMLEDAGELEQLAERHRAHYLDQAINGPDRSANTRRAWHRLFSANRLDFAEAIGATFEIDAKSATDGFQSLAMFLIDTGRESEARALATNALTSLEQLDTEHRATLLQAAGQVTFFMSDWRHAADLLEEALNCRRHAGGPQSVIAALNSLGVALIRSPRFDEARSSFEEAIAIARSTDDAMLLAAPLTNLGISYLLSGPPLDAAPLLTEALQLVDDSADEMGMSIVSAWLAADSWLRGDPAHAVELYDTAVTIQRRFDARGFLARNLTLRNDVILEMSGAEAARGGLQEALGFYGSSLRRLHFPELVEISGYYATAVGDAETAAELLGTADSIRNRLGILEPEWSRGRRRSVESDLRTELAAREFDAAYRRGSLRGSRNTVAHIRRLLDRSV